MLKRAAAESVHIHHNFAVRGLQEAGGVLGLAVGLEAWFHLPEQGMAAPEILARGSAFVTPAAAHLGRTLHVLAPAHVTHPWRYRGDFYRGDEYAWLEHVRPEAVESRLTLREPGSGRLLLALPLEQPLLHSAADLVVYALADESRQLALLETHQLELLPLELCTGPGEVQVGGPTVLVGHDHRSDSQLVPVSLNGVIEGHSGGITVVRTFDDQSLLGMCGGPALVAVPGEGVKAAGLIFARVDSGPLTGATLLVSSGLVSEFLASNKC